MQLDDSQQRAGAYPPLPEPAAQMLYSPPSLLPDHMQQEALPTPTAQPPHDSYAPQASAQPQQPHQGAYQQNSQPLQVAYQPSALHGPPGPYQSPTVSTCTLSLYVLKVIEPLGLIPFI